MRILHISHRYQASSPAGHTRAVELDLELTAAAGHHVISLHAPSTDGSASRLGRARELQLIWKPAADQMLSEAIEDFQPDLVHAHGFRDGFTGTSVRVAQRRGVKIINTEHGYFSRCATSFYIRNGTPCFECRDAKSGRPAFTHGCVPPSRLVMRNIRIASEAINHRRWQAVDAHIAITPAVREQLLRDGFDPAKVHVIVSAEPDPGEPVPAPTGGGVAFAARFDDQKGAPLLVKAWLQSEARHHTRLRLAGAGLAESAMRLLAKDEPSIEFLGIIPEDEVLDLYRSSEVVAFPSQMEPFGRSAAKALAVGRPLLTIAESGNGIEVDSSFAWQATERTPTSLARALDEAMLVAPSSERERRGAAARKIYVERYRTERYLDDLFNLYQRVLAEQ